MTTGDIRQASVEAGPDDERLPLAAQAGPFALLAAGAIWLRSRWDGLPARIPIHWNYRGVADGYVPKTPLAVAMPLLLGLAVAVMLLALQVGLRTSAPRGAMRRPALKLLLAGEYFVAALCWGIVAASATSGRLLWPVLALSFAGAVALLGYTVVVARRAGRAPVRNPSAWHAGIFYVDRSDPALLVPKRSGLGYTFNFGHPGAVVLAVVFLIIPIVIAAYALSAR